MTGVQPPQLGRNPPDSGNFSERTIGNLSKFSDCSPNRFIVLTVPIVSMCSSSSILFTGESGSVDHFCVDNFLFDFPTLVIENSCND